jgi:secondary thiamine-phosphate synthase enzyme
MWQQKTIRLKAKAQGFHLVTAEILAQLAEIKAYKTGLVHLMLRHTSAGLTLNENADPTVRSDLNEFMHRLVPENQHYFQHTLEGSDDMPAHIKSSLVGHQLMLPITDGVLNLGMWQGIYLGEYRVDAGPRDVFVTIQGLK